MDFYQISTKEVEAGPKKGTIEVFPDFKVGRSKDLMVRGRGFYAVWDEAAGLWSTDEYDVQRLVDEELDAYVEQRKDEIGLVCTVKHLRSYGTNGWNQFQKFMKNISDNSQQLDQSLTFANTEVKKSDHVSRRLPYSLEPGDHGAWDELVGTLYSVEEKAKIEWIIGAIVSGDSKKIQKFGVFYGPGGTGKSTILNIIEKLFVGYTTAFEAKALGSSNNAFATEAFKHNPLVAIQQDGDLSKIDDNTKLNSIISHEDMTMNEKYKASYTARVNAFLLMGTNQPVKISDAKSGIIRRLIDIHPTGVLIPAKHYTSLVSRIDFELGAIAHHCLEVYRSMGKNYYDAYKPLEMMLQTDIFFNFIEAHFDIFKTQNQTTLRQAYALYKEYCEETGIDRVLPQYKFRGELRNYFDEFHERMKVDDQFVRSVYTGFNASKFKSQSKRDSSTFSLVIEETESLLDELFAEQPAQYGTKYETPSRPWEKITGTLADIDTAKLHFVKIPKKHLIIDFDLKDENGNKSLERNLEAASVWPATYAELSKSGEGVHLHYNYDGDVAELGNSYSEGIEVKTLLGNSSLRRRLTKCNNVPVATLNEGVLPVKEKKVLDVNMIKSERGLRNLIARNMQKEFHASTKSSMDFIKHILDEEYAKENVSYDVSDLKPKLMAFANNSSNQAIYCLGVLNELKLKSKDVDEVNPVEDIGTTEISAGRTSEDERLVFYDVEVYPNLFVVCWKYAGDPTVVRMINPSPADIEALLAFRLVGFNNRRYDNHILWARFTGYSNEQLYNLSQKLISNDRNAAFGSAYSISYADIYDFSSKKQGLKKFEIELGLPHIEMDIPWDKPVPDEIVMKVVDYCANDVVATEAVFESRKQDFIARQILADVSGLTVNDTTQKHTARIMFGNDRNPQRKFTYTKLGQKEFPGYSFDATRKPKSLYRDEDPSEGGYVYAEPGMYENVAVLDVASMHPTSMIQLNIFGEYTPKFSALVEARIAIKHKNYDAARKMLNGKLAPHLDNPADADALSYALKIVINIVYGLTSAKFDNPFRDIRNHDNIVAKRGALFMIDLKHYVQEELGLQVVHIKTDSIKIPNASPEHIEAVQNFGSKYGYSFEHEATYEKLCLVNDAVYIAKYGWAEKEKLIGNWHAVGAQFQHPYVFKKLFSEDEIVFNDLCETKQVIQGSMYLDFDRAPTPDDGVLDLEAYQFVGRTGRFVPVKEGYGGGVLYRIKDGKKYAVTGTKGYLWKEATMAEALEDSTEAVDVSYFEKLADEAVKSIEKYGDFSQFAK